MPPLIVELVGPAGAGKSTLTQALNWRSSRVLPIVHPCYRNIGQAPFFARNSLLALPTLAALAAQHHPLMVGTWKRSGANAIPAFRDGDWLSRREIAWMVILTGWHTVLRRQGSVGKDVVVLDQGPVYLLTELHAFGSRVLASRPAKEWWARMYEQWADTLDLVIRLDADDEVLAQRIRARVQCHIVKDESDEKISEFLGQFRTAYDTVISRLLASSRRLRILRLDTGEESLDETANRILAACRLNDDRRGTGCRTSSVVG